MVLEVNSIVNSIHPLRNHPTTTTTSKTKVEEEEEGAHALARSSQASDRRKGPLGGGRSMADGGSSDSASSFHSVEDPTRRIKNLDTGEEYFVGQAEATVRDAGTGVEVSMEDFQHAMGISPIEKEVARRERSMDTTTATRHNRRATHQDEQASTTGPQEHAHNTSIRSSIKNAFRGFRRGKRGTETHEIQEETKVPTQRVEHESQAMPTSTRNATLPTDVRPNLKNKLYKDLLDVKLTQELVAHRSAVWTLKFSLDGKYLASAGQDTVVRVWEVMQCGKEGEETHLETETKPEAAGAVIRRRTSYEPGTECDPMFQPKPCRLFAGHKSDVLDLSWSDSQFLLSASMDKTVRLWHISMDECLRVFTHHDFVTSISFNPVDDKFFVSGSLDEKLRIWNIPDHNVADWVDVHEMVTAVSYSPDGKRVVVGTFKGKCKFYRAENNKLEYITQIEVRSKRGKNARGKKITGIQFLDGNSKRMLVSSNDSRIRLYDGYNLLCKYKGHKNKASQIRAFFSQNGDFIVSGSEDGSLYVWSTVHSLLPIMNPIFARLKKEKDAACEFFPAHVGTTTVALFAPESSTRSKKLLSRLAFANKIAGTSPDPEHSRLLQEVRTYSPELGAAKLAEASMTAVGQVIVTAGFGGEIKVFESFGLSLGP